MKSSDDKRANESKDQKLLRCVCGRLVARLVPAGVELKCRRCKRYVIVPLDLRGQKKIEVRA